MSFHLTEITWEIKGFPKNKMPEPHHVQQCRAQAEKAVVDMLGPGAKVMADSVRWDESRDSWIYTYHVAHPA